MSFSHIIGSLNVSFCPGQIWDRQDFLAHCGRNTQALSDLMDNALADCFPTAPLLSAAIRRFFIRLEDAVDVGVATRLAGIAIASHSGGRFSPSISTTVFSSRDFSELQKGILSTWFCDSSFWVRAGAEECAKWLEDFPEAASIKGGKAFPLLLDLASTHMLLSLWPMLVDSNLLWRVDRANPMPRPLDHSLHYLFSLSGAVPAEGSLVFPCGPSLQGREPWEIQKRGGASRFSNSTFDLSEFRGKQCRETCAV